MSLDLKAWVFALLIRVLMQDLRRLLWQLVKLLGVNELGNCLLELPLMIIKGRLNSVLSLREVLSHKVRLQQVLSCVVIL